MWNWSKEILLNSRAGGLFKVRDFKSCKKKIVFYWNNEKLRKKWKFGFKSIDEFDYNKNLNKYYSKKFYTN